MQFILNDTEYTIYESCWPKDNGKYLWCIDAENIESKLFDSKPEARADAMRHAEERYNKPSDWKEQNAKLFCRGE